jgi:hypothetical protein
MGLYAAEESDGAALSQVLGAVIVCVAALGVLAVLGVLAWNVLFA